MLRQLTSTLAALAALGTPAAAQQAPRAVTVVEILGLRRWTPRMVEDSVARFQPGITLADHACAVILRDSVGFADAAVQTFMWNDTTWAVLSVVEPDMKDRVRFRSYAARRAPEPSWADLREILEKHPAAMPALQDPGVLLADSQAFFGRPLPDGADELRRRLRQHGSARDWQLASAAILSDSSYDNRQLAALVLSNFRERDSTFYLITEGLRTTDAGATAARIILSTLARGAPRRVNWAPARPALEALLGGTDLFAYDDLLDALVTTGIEPALGHTLVQRNPALLLDHLGARNPFTRPTAHRFLVHIHGADLGWDPSVWRPWLER